MTDTGDVVRQVRETLAAFNINDVEGKVSWSIVHDLSWWLRFGNNNPADMP